MAVIVSNVTRPGSSTGGRYPTEAGEIAEGEELEVVDALKKMIVLLRDEEPTLRLCDDYLYGNHAEPFTPAEVSREYQLLAKRSVTNVVPLVVGNFSQLLSVQGFLPKGASDNSKVWEDSWQPNRMDSRQSAIIRSVIQYGVAYVHVTEQGVDAEGSPKPLKIRGISPKHCTALYLDAANDEWPVWAMEVSREDELSGKDVTVFKVYNDKSEFKVVRDGRNKKVGEEGFEVVSTTPHTATVTPIVRMTASLDLEGRYQGEIEPLIVGQDRLNQTVMDRLLVQTFGAYKIRTVTGMAVPDDDVEARKLKLSTGVSNVMISDDPDTKFGTLPETSMAGFIEAATTDKEALAALSAIPPHYLTGTLNNLGTEAIAEARASLDARVGAYKIGLGEGIEQLMRLCGKLSGDEAAWLDYSAQVVWKDSNNRSLAQTADALGKMATMLGIPVKALWPRIPGVTPADVENWIKLAEDDDLQAKIDEINATSAEETQPDADANTSDEEPSGPDIGGI